MSAANPTKKSPWRDRSVLIRSSAATVGLLVALTGCGALMPGGNTGTGADTTTASSTSGNGPGVTEASVKVVFIATDLDAIQKLTGFKTASVGDQRAQVQALEDWVNDNGGLGGRKMEAVFRLYDAAKDTPAAEEQLCKQITQDDKAFAVVLTGQYQPNARPCYAQAKTLMFDAALMASDEQYYEELAPYLWTASFPEYAGFVRGFVGALGDSDFFDDRDSVGLIAADTEINRRVARDEAIPLLEELGIEPHVSWVDTTDTGTLYTGLQQAATTFQGKRVDRVVFLGGARLAAMFASVSGSTGFKARYGISSFDNPTYFVNNPDSIPEGITDGMIGIGFHPPQEVKEDHMSFPNDQESACTDIYDAAGIEFENREAARVALPYCDATRLLKLGADALEGDFNAGNWSTAVKANGSDFVTASGFGGALEHSHAAAGGYRPMEFDNDCNCFEYTGEEQAFHGD